jgi:hypothetical protein
MGQSRGFGAGRIAYRLLRRIGSKPEFPAAPLRLECGRNSGAFVLSVVG